MSPAPGAARTITDEQVEQVLVMTLETTPTDATHWSTRSLARATGMSQSAISRTWRAFGLKPHLVDTFKLSTDPQFIDKVRDVVGLYLNPPQAAMVLCGSYRGYRHDPSTKRSGRPGRSGPVRSLPGIGIDAARTRTELAGGPSSRTIRTARADVAASVPGHARLAPYGHRASGWSWPVGQPGATRHPIWPSRRPIRPR